ncbi:MAG: LuxR C-terminal-related transcriptional regulator [Vicinamibacterales bacterium]|nr:LuxR C-terminal-related transcriptional regulator [Vicinamibacterales bacterium]
MLVRQLVDRTADGAFAVDHSLRIQAWNEAATTLLGHRAGEVVGRPCYAVLAGRADDGALFCRRRCEPLQCALAGGLQPNFEICARTHDGRVRWINMSIVAMPVTPNGGGSMVHFFRPIDRQKRLEAFVKQTISSAAEHLPARPRASESPATAARLLSGRERDVLRLLRNGLPTHEVACALGIGDATVRTHTQHILEKLGLHSKTAAVLYAERHGID